MKAFLQKWMAKIVTPAFITFNAHMWLAYAVVCTWLHIWTVVIVILGAGVKEFWWDKHFEANQSFDDDMQDFAGYCAGVLLAIAVHTL